MAQYRVLASERRQRYSVFTKTPKNILGKKIKTFWQEPMFNPLPPRKILAAEEN
jgi:hypothetical protein